MTPYPTVPVSNLVSIIIPSYNSASTIVASVESALEQTHKPCEIIVIDDGSSDNTGGILQQYGKRISYHFVPNGGANLARNLGAQLAVGEWLQFLDSDDILHPEKIARQLDALHTSQAGFAFGPLSLFQGAPPLDQPKPRLITATFEPRRFLELFLGHGLSAELSLTDASRYTYANTSSLLIPREIFLRSGGWDESLLDAHDTEIVIRLATLVENVTFTGGAWTFYRIGNPASISATITPAKIRSQLAAATKVSALLDLRWPGAFDVEIAFLFGSILHGMPTWHPEFHEECQQQIRKRGMLPAAALPTKRSRRLATIMGTRFALDLIRLIHKIGKARARLAMV